MQKDVIEILNALYPNISSEIFIKLFEFLQEQKNQHFNIENDYQT